MKLKDGVDISALSPEMQIANGVAAVIWSQHGHELVITAGRDGEHMEGSSHYIGEACDYRTRYFLPGEASVVARKLELRLGPDYDVVVHSTHIHCEYDPKGGRK